MFVPWPPMFPKTVPPSAAATVVVFGRRPGSGCRVGAVGVLWIASSLIAADAWLVADRRYYYYPCCLSNLLELLSLFVLLFFSLPPSTAFEGFVLAYCL